METPARVLLGKEEEVNVEEPTVAEEIDPDSGREGETEEIEDLEGGAAIVVAVVVAVAAAAAAAAYSPPDLSGSLSPAADTKYDKPGGKMGGGSSPLISACQSWQ
ncbi:UNVERIFIED_CONTAM: hypothetical protein FKN15_023354 [Acipenser sinensis]